MAITGKVLILDDNPTRIQNWRVLIAAEGWEDDFAIGNTAESLFCEASVVIKKFQGRYIATIADVMLGRDNVYGGIDALDKLVQAFGRDQFGEIVIASSIETSDRAVIDCQSRYGAIRSASPLSKSLSEVVQEIKRRILLKKRQTE